MLDESQSSIPTEPNPTISPDKRTPASSARTHGSPPQIAASLDTNKAKPTNQGSVNILDQMVDTPTKEGVEEEKQISE